MSVRTFIQSPWTSLFSLLIGVFGVIWGFYTYEAGKNEGIVAYVSESRPIMLPAKTIDTKFYVDGREIVPQSEVFLSAFTVWNSGNATVEDKDIRSPIKIFGDQSVRFFYAKISNTLSETTDNFRIIRDDADVKIHWKLLDPGEAVKILLVHTGDPSTLSLGGKFGPGKYVAKYGWLDRSKVASGIMILINIFLFLHAAGMLNSLIPGIPSSNRPRSYKLYAGLLVLSSIVVGVTTYFGNRKILISSPIDYQVGD